jgi:hypothetical protein
LDAEILDESKNIQDKLINFKVFKHIKRTIKIEKLFLKRFMLKLNHGDIKK